MCLSKNIVFTVLFAFRNKGGFVIFWVETEILELKRKYFNEKAILCYAFDLFCHSALWNGRKNIVCFLSVNIKWKPRNFKAVKLKKKSLSLKKGKFSLQFAVKNKSRWFLFQREMQLFEFKGKYLWKNYCIYFILLRYVTE